MHGFWKILSMSGQDKDPFGSSLALLMYYGPPEQHRNVCMTIRYMFHIQSIIDQRDSLGVLGKLR